MRLGTRERRLLDGVRQALASSLDLHEVLGNASPLLLDLVPADYAALGITKPFSSEFEWIVARMPPGFFEAYPAMAADDFVLRSVLAAPNQVLRDSEMVSRRELERNRLYGCARDLGMPLEHVMSAMLHADGEWSSGISLYRSERRPFSDLDRAILDALMPDFRRTVQNCRRFADADRKAQLFDSVLSHEGLAVVLLSPRGGEIGRTAAATVLLERHFPPHARRVGALPEDLLVRENGVLAVRQHALPTPAGTCTALVLEERAATTLPASWQRRLTPREREVTAGLLAGWDNQLIATELGCSVLTVKKHVSSILDKLGADTRQQLLARARDKSA
jgi:DNA-binding CsgD family transcriptional regulator